MLQELILKNRSYRRFYQEHEITKSELINFIDMARLSPSPRNQQALKFIISCEKQKNNKIFETLSWAGAIQNWDGPKEGEKPSAYIIILGDNDIVPSGKNSFNEAAYGIAAQTILLATVEKELGGCMIAAIKKNILRKELEIDKVDFIKMDIEGAEIEALKGMEETLLKNNDVKLAIEAFHVVDGKPTSETIIPQLKNLEFEVCEEGGFVYAKK